MDFKVIVKYSMMISLLLVLSGVPLGFFIEDSTNLENEFLGWIVFYKYTSIFFIGFICFYFLGKSNAKNPLVNGIMIVLVSSLGGVAIELIIVYQVNYNIWLINAILMFFSLIIGYGASCIYKESSEKNNS